ncbi:polysaccharide biosynthesis/export family protein [Psychroserpens luteolus]|uniref:polysaccharide biosynthesis/export family protein n=1 Tax=Psychroserpens luteolus TaxID=2855840 RepID=UPI001E2C6A8A|nr:polysaccharide biosynthesis/export family protein [Psychroserpens luteolus]MCD2257635.1 polysaccharide biosynthesis/export family protein [Psychroserpens luteolus]
MKIKFLGLVLLFVITSCASKKEILYLQDATENNSSEITYQTATIQPNDILKITVESLVPEAAIPYNRGGNSDVQVNSLELIKLQGYLVTNEGTINFPILGQITVSNLTALEIEEKIKKLLIDGGHLNNPTLEVRLVNAKITVLGEVNAPGTYNFTEQNITLLQALGYAGDLTINGKRDDIIMTRDVDGVRKITHIDLTSTAFMDSEYYFIKPNDVIIVNPNNPRVKNAGFVNNVGTILTIASLVLSSIILLTR